MEEAQKLPAIKVLYCSSHGGFEFSKAFITFVRSRTKITEIDYDSLRSDPVLIQAIGDYGRFICSTYPFILEDMRSVYTWKLDKLLANLKKLPMEFNPDLVAEAMSFVNQWSNAKGHRLTDCLGSFPKEDNSGPDLEAFTEEHPDFWMAHRSMTHRSMSYESATFQVALRFAHVLLQGGDHTRYHVEPDEAQDAAIYERIGLCGASTRHAKLAIKKIPALVDFSIHEYDGRETVVYDCDVVEYFMT